MLTVVVAIAVVLGIVWFAQRSRVVAIRQSIAWPGFARRCSSLPATTIASCHLTTRSGHNDEALFAGAEVMSAIDSFLR